MGAPKTLIVNVLFLIIDNISGCMKKLVRVFVLVLAGVLALVVLLLACGSLFGGPVASSYLNAHGEELVGRRVTVERVGLNLFTGSVRVKGLTVYEDDGKERFAGFDSLRVDVSLLRAVGRRVQVRRLRIAGLEVEVRRERSGFNFTSIIEHFQQADTAADTEQDTTGGGWVVSLHNMELVRGRLGYTDAQRGSRAGMNDLNLKVPDLTIGGSEGTDAGLTLAFDGGGRLTAKAAVDGTTNRFDAAVGIEGFALEQLRPYVAEAAQVGGLKGRLALRAEAKGQLDSLSDVDLRLWAGVDDAEMRDLSQGPVVQLGHLGVDVERMVPGKNVYDINGVEVEGLKVRYELFADGTNTLSRLLRQQPAGQEAAQPEPQEAEEPEAESAKAAQRPLHLRVGKLSLRDVSVTLADHTLPDEFEFAVKDVRLRAENLTASGANNARLMATLPSGGKAMVNWEGNISDWKLNQRLMLSVKNLHLTDLSPYMVAYFGMPFSDGVFSFTSLNTIRNSELKGDNKIDIFKPTLGEKRADVKPKLHLPVRAALYVLKDKDGKVLLPVPVSGNVDNPKFNYMKLVWKTLGNLIVKVVTSPLGTSDSVALDADGNVWIAVDADEHDFTSEQFYQIDRVAELAKVDESVTLDFCLYSRPDGGQRAAENHERRNRILRHHLAEAGVAEGQLSISEAPCDDTHRDEGYVVKIETR